jgi:hypothetical protein
MKHKLLTLASAAALLAACSDSSVSDANDEIKETATVTFMVVDANTQLPLEDVSIYFRPEDKTKSTDSAGTSVWKDVEIGTDIYWDFQLDGYAMKRFVEQIKDETKNDVARVHDIHPKILMYELGVDIKGQFFYTDVETGDWKPAQNVTVYAKYDDEEIYPNEVYTKTDENGNYTFKNMASNADIHVLTERFLVDSTIVYEVEKIDDVNERKGVVKELNPKAAAVAGLAPVLLESNLKNLDSTSALTLTFSEVLEKDSVKTTQIYVENDKAKKVAVNVSLSEDGKTVTVKPAAGKWVDGASYTVYFSTWSKVALEDVDADGKRDFDVGKIKIPEPVKGLQLDTAEIAKIPQDVVISFFGERTYATLHDKATDNDTIAYNATVKVIWDEVEAKGVKGFKIYVKGDNTDNADFIEIDDVKDATASAYQFDVATALCLLEDLKFPISKKDVQEVEIMVLPYSNAGVALAKDAKTVKAKIAEVAEDEMTLFEEATVKTLSDLTYSAGQNCTDKNVATCGSAVPKAKVFDGDYFTMSFSTNFAWDTDYPVTPVGYDIYFKAADGEWKLTTVSAFSGIDFVVDWQNDDAKKSTEKSEDAEVFVMPYFHNASGDKVSATEINKSSKNYKSSTWSNIATK